MTVTASDLYALGLAVGSLLRGHVDPARQDRVLDLIRTLERQAAGDEAHLHTGMAAHGGYAMHSHEVRPDHLGVRWDDRP